MANHAFGRGCLSLISRCSIPGATLMEYGESETALGRLDSAFRSDDRYCSHGGANGSNNATRVLMKGIDRVQTRQHQEKVFFKFNHAGGDTAVLCGRVAKLLAGKKIRARFYGASHWGDYSGYRGNQYHV